MKKGQIKKTNAARWKIWQTENILRYIFNMDSATLFVYLLFCKDKK